MANNKVTLVIIVNGTPVEVEANPHAELRTVVNKALADSHNTGRPASDWELSDHHGNVLDLAQKIGSFGFTDGTRLMLNLKVGVQGSLMTELLVDLDVSCAKFEREVAAFRAIEDDYRQRGCFLYRAVFPEVVLLFATANVRPAMLVFGARIDFSNYDLWAPSVRLVDPFTLAPYRLREAPTRLLRAQRITPDDAPQPLFQPAPLLIAHNQDDVPFVCLPGIREYHEHPAHTGDSWLLHRGRGEGTLTHLAALLARYGVEHARPQVQMRVGIEYTELPQ